MSVEIEPVSRESHRDSRHVRLQDTPEYIPMLNQGMLAVMGCNTPPVGAQRPRKSTAEGDNNKDQSENDKGRRKTMIGDGASDTTTTELDNEFKSIGIMTAAKLILKSKKAAKKAKSKCRQNAAKRLIKQLTQDSEMFQRYNLADVHNKMKRQKQLRLAFIQKRFLDELPILAEKSVKDHLDKRIEVLENLKKQQSQQPLNNGRSTKLQLEKMEEYERPNSRILTRRQSQLRKSFDLSTLPLNLFCDISNPDLTPTKEDLQNLLAMAKSREKIESDLDLPMDRMQRLSTLRKNVNRINEKFKSLKETKNGLKKDTDEEATEEKFYAPSRFIKIGLAKSFFRRYVRLVMIVQQWIKMIMNKRYDFEKELKSFVDMASDIEHQTISSSMMEFGLSFDRKFYKANTEISLSNDARKILTTTSQSRTPAMIKQVMNGLHSLRSLSEYPVQTQEKLCQCAWYQTIGPKKLIIRQGHKAQQFYFILSGTAFVKKMTQDPVTGETKATVAARLTKGHSFGGCPLIESFTTPTHSLLKCGLNSYICVLEEELLPVKSPVVSDCVYPVLQCLEKEIGLLFNTLRTATVESATAMELLVIGKEDFERIFMKADDPDAEPDHLKFLRQIPFMRNWPVRVLPEEPGACLVHYFKRGTLITENDKHSEWIYFIMSGSCEVLKKLRGVKGRPPSELRPKSHPLTDIILPELGMPNNHPKIDTGKRNSNKRTIHPDLYRTMSDYYDDLRRRVPSREDLKAVYRPGSLDSVRNEKQYTNTDVFVKVELLHQRDTFGLNTLKYCMDADDDVFDVNSDMESPILSLVSCGAEVIMLSKKVFLKYADQKCRTAVRDHIKVYPSEDILQDNMQLEADWSLFKNITLEEQLREKKLRTRLLSSGIV